MNERVYFDENGIRVTDSEFAVQGRTRPISRIARVEVRNYGAGGVNLTAPLLVIGLLLSPFPILAAVYAILTLQGIALVGLIIIVAAALLFLVAWFMKNVILAPNSYSLQVEPVTERGRSISGGGYSMLDSSDKRLVRTVADALREAMEADRAAGSQRTRDSVGRGRSSLGSFSEAGDRVKRERLAEAADALRRRRPKDSP